MPIVKTLKQSKLPKKWELMHSQMEYWFTKTLLDAGLPKKIKEGTYNMRSIRCYIATEWIKLKTEYEQMEYPNEPINPLQHIKPGITANVYADLQADDVLAAR